MAGDGINKIWRGQTTEPFYLEKLMNAGVGPYIDIASIHFYEEDVFAALDKIDRFCEALDQYGLGDRPVWITEAGYGFASVNQAGYRARQAQFIKEMYGTLMLHPRVEKLFWWHLGGYPYVVPETDRHQAFLSRLINNQYEPWPAYTEFKNLEKPAVRRVWSGEPNSGGLFFRLMGRPL
jgi:hypothetical protein